MSKFSINLTQLIKEYDISQSQLAQELNVKQQTISRYINGTREPDFSTIIKIAKYFEVTTDFLLGVEE